MEEQRNESSFNWFGLLSNALSGAIGFAAGSAVGANRERRKWQKKYEDLESDVVPEDLCRYLENKKR